MGTVDQDSVTVAVCDPRVDIRSQNRVALDLLPGFTFASRFTIFARLGVEFSSYSWVRRIDIPDATMSDLVGVPIEFNVVGQEVTDKETDTIGGVRLGVGVSYVVSPNISLQLSWVHIATGTAEFVPNRDLILDAAPVIDNDLQPDDVDIEASIDTLLAKNTIKPTRNEVLLGVVFTF
jgi:opacity protein-like surface antigen